MIIDTLDRAKSYMASDALREALDFLGSLGADTPDGEYPIRGTDIFARAMRYKSIRRREGKLESHRKYADIQALLSGEELVQWVPLKAHEDAPYNSEDDVSFHKVPSDCNGSFVLTPGLFSLFMPGDAHMPMLRCGGEASEVTKVVIKVDAGLIVSGVLDYGRAQDV